MHWIKFKKKKGFANSTQNLSLFLSCGNLKTLENLIFSDIFWKVKSTESIVFIFKFLEETTKVFTVFFRLRKNQFILYFLFSDDI